LSEPAVNEMAISIRVHSHLKYTDLFHTVLTQVAKDLSIPQERLDWVALSLREAVNNAVLHGSKNDPKRWIEVEMEVTEKELVIKVWDEGKGFPEGVLRDPRNPENLLRPNGRGIFLIRQFVDKVEFDRDRKGRFGIVMTVNLATGETKEETQ
jgi:serine/threonine-protein kinase RsbW